MNDLEYTAAVDYIYGFMTNIASPLWKDNGLPFLEARINESLEILRQNPHYFTASTKQ